MSLRATSRMRASSTRPALPCISRPARHTARIPLRMDAGYSSSGRSARRKSLPILATSRSQTKGQLKPVDIGLGGKVATAVADAHPIVQRARDLKLAQIHPDVDHVLSQSRKIDKIASSDVARSRVDWNTFHTMIK